MTDHIGYLQLSMFTTALNTAALARFQWKSSQESTQSSVSMLSLLLKHVHIVYSREVMPCRKSVLNCESISKKCTS